MENRKYLCIDLKSFYASVECVERGLNPLTTNLVVADPERGKGTVCLAITPSMKEKGVKNRCRVYEIPADISYIMAPPRMKLYIKYAADIYEVYLKHIAKEDIHVYSIDEAFFDVTDYLGMYQMDERGLAKTILDDVKNTTGITATAGMGTNLYLAKIALDILAKHAKDYIGFLDEEAYQRKLWKHRPLTDFWRIGAGTEKRLKSIGVLTMEDITRMDEDILYRMFGVDAELLIDHAWGRESVTMADIKEYKPQTNSISNGQVLLRDYSFEEGIVIVKEMLDSLCLQLMEKEVVTESVTLTVGYSYVTGCKPDGGTASFSAGTNLYQEMLPSVLEIYRSQVKKEQPIRKITMSCNKIREQEYEQLSLFTDYDSRERERNLRKAILKIRKRYGKNALLRGMDLLEEGTAVQRNRQIGGHKSGE